MALSDLTLKNEYRSDNCNLTQDFYIPCLENSFLYCRAVGFFSSTSMATVAKGLTALLHSGGKMRLVSSPCLSQEDAAAIAQGLSQREEIVTQSLLRELEQEFEEVVKDRLACLAWLLSKGLLEIKLAICKDIRSHRGIYHEKLGLFSDREGNLVAFTGSANESSSALMDNFECIDVFCSWEKGVRERALSKQENFLRLWENRTPSLDILDFPEAAKRSLLRLRPNNPPIEPIPRKNPVMGEAEQGYIPIVSNPERGIPILPDTLSSRDYQKQAISNWFENHGRGTLKMATGSGKTITALAIATELHQKIGLQVLLIVCPYRHLVIQWERECQKFGLEPILAFEKVHNWQARLSTQLYNVRSGHQKFLTIITTNTTLIGQGLQSQLRYLPDKTLIVGDEAHNLGSKRLAESLPRNVGLRLALSATPERYFDELGTEALFDYFGAVIQPEVTLADAIRAGALVHYLYYPILVELTESETEKYAELTKKIGKAIALEGDSEIIAALLMQRARLLGSAANKLNALRELMQQRLETTHTLIYCGDGSVEDEVTETSTSQLNAVAQLLGSDLGYRVNTYTAETSLEERENLRLLFETGDLQGLVAIRCLDEGVDIPAIQTAIMLASSTNPRQFIQRRGRILRAHPHKTRATLFDTIVLPPDLGRDSMDVERNLLRKELQRFVEFANLADNCGEARLKLVDLQKRYGLLDL